MRRIKDEQTPAASRVEERPHCMYELMATGRVPQYAFTPYIWPESRRMVKSDLRVTHGGRLSVTETRGDLLWSPSEAVGIRQR